MTNEELRAIEKMQELAMESAKLKAEVELLKKENGRLWMLVHRIVELGDE